MNSIQALPRRRKHPLLEGLSSTLATCYNRRSFPFEHYLHKNPLFDLDRLERVVSAEPELTRSAYCSSTNAEVAQGWAAGSPRHQVSDAIHGISSSNSLVMLRHVERSVSIGPALRSIIEEVVAAVGPKLQSDAKSSRATILIASPRRITPYHIDSDTNFLFQICGDKRMSVFDPRDPTLVTARELENFYAGDISAAIYKPARQADAQVFDMHPGSAVHIPTHAPHWAQNGNSVSIALSINFDLYSVERTAHIHRLNAKLRRMGLAPRAPGDSAWRDDIKLGLCAFNRGLHRCLGRQTDDGPADTGASRSPG